MLAEAAKLRVNPQIIATVPDSLYEILISYRYSSGSYVEKKT